MTGIVNVGGVRINVIDFIHKNHDDSIYFRHYLFREYIIAHSLSYFHKYNI